MKKKNVFFALGLVLTMGVGVTASLAASNKAFEPARANNTPTTVYVAIDSATRGSYSLKFNAKLQGTEYADGDAQWETGNMTAEGETFDGKDVYSYSFTIPYDGLSKLQFQLYDGSTWKAQDEVYGGTEWVGVSTFNNKVWVYGSTGDDRKWNTYTPDTSTKYSVDVYVDGVKTGTEEISEGSLPEEPDYSFGQSFSGWFSDSACSEGHEVTGVTSNAPIYCKTATLPTVTYSIDTTNAPSSLKSGLKVYAWEPTGKLNAAWPGLDVVGTTITLPNDAKFIINNGNDAQTVDITQTGIANDTLRIKSTQTGSKYDTEWASDDVITYSLKVNGSTEVELELDDGEKPAGVLHQYSGAIPTAHFKDTLTFFKNTTQISSNIGVDYEDDHPVAGNNIVGDAENSFKVYHSTDNMMVYLKSYEGGGYSLWGAGYAENSFNVTISNTNLTIDNDFTPADGYVKQYKSSAAVALAVREVAVEKYMINDQAGSPQLFTVEAGDTNNALQVTNYQFNVRNACTEVIYLKMKADLSLYLYIGGRIHTRVLTIGENQVPLTLYQPQPSDPVQYRATGVNLKAGNSISYLYDGEEAAISAKPIYNNNLTSGLYVLVDAVADLYLDAEGKLWVSGLDLPNGGYGLLVGNPDSNTIEYVATTVNPSNEHEYFTNAHTFKTNDIIKIIHGEGNALPDYFDPAGGLNASSIAGHFDKDGNEVVCTDGITCQAYIQLEYGNDKLYFGSVSEEVALAVEFAADFKSAMATACSAVNKQEAVEDAWAQAASDYAALKTSKPAAADVLDLGGYSEYDEIQEFAERYIAIKRQHKTWTLANFMEWDIPASNYTLIAKVGNGSMMLIILVSGATILASAGFAYFLIRRRKNAK